MLILAKICADPCKQYCNRIRTVPCKRIAQTRVKIRALKNCPDLCQRDLIHFSYVVR